MKGFILVISLLAALATASDCTPDEMAKFAASVVEMVKLRDRHVAETNKIRDKMNVFYWDLYNRFPAGNPPDKNAVEYYKVLGEQPRAQLDLAFADSIATAGQGNDWKTDYQISHAFFAHFSWPLIKHCFVDLKVQFKATNTAQGEIKTLEDLEYFMTKIKEHRKNIIFTSLAFTACGVPVGDKFQNFAGMEIMNSAEYWVAHLQPDKSKRHVEFKKFSFDVSKVKCDFVAARSYAADKERKNSKLESLFLVQLQKIREEAIVSISWDSFGSDDPTSDFDLSVNVQRATSIDLKNADGVAMPLMLKSHLHDINTINAIVDVANDRVMESGWRPDHIERRLALGLDMDEIEVAVEDPQKQASLDLFGPRRLLEEVLDSNSYPEIIDGYKVLFKDDTWAKDNRYINFLASVEFGLHTTANFIFIQSCFKEAQISAESAEHAIFELMPDTFCDRVMSLVGSKKDKMSNQGPEMFARTFNWKATKAQFEQIEQIEKIEGYKKIQPRESEMSMSLYNQLRMLNPGLLKLEAELETLGARGKPEANDLDEISQEDQSLKEAIHLEIPALQLEYRRAAELDLSRKMWAEFATDRQEMNSFFYERINGDKDFDKVVQDSQDFQGHSSEQKKQTFMQWRRKKFTDCFLGTFGNLPPSDTIPEKYYWKVMTQISTCHFWAAEAYLTYGSLMAFKEKKEPLNLRTQAESAVENTVMFLEHAAHALHDSEHNLETKELYGYEGVLMDFDVSDKFKYLIRSVESLRAKCKIPVSGGSSEFWGTILDSSLLHKINDGRNPGYDIANVYKLFKAIDMYNYNNIEARFKARKESKKDLYKVAVEAYRYGLDSVRYVGLIAHVFQHHHHEIKNQVVPVKTPLEVVQFLAGLKFEPEISSKDLLDPELTAQEKRAYYEKIKGDPASILLILGLPAKTNKQIMQDVFKFYLYVKDVTTNAVTLNYVEHQVSVLTKIFSRSDFARMNDYKFDPSRFDLPPKPQTLEFALAPSQIAEKYAQEIQRREDAAAKLLPPVKEEENLIMKDKVDQDNQGGANIGDQINLKIERRVKRRSVV